MVALRRASFHKSMNQAKTGPGSLIMGKRLVSPITLRVDVDVILCLRRRFRKHDMMYEP